MPDINMTIFKAFHAESSRHLNQIKGMIVDCQKGGNISPDAMKPIVLAAAKLMDAARIVAIDDLFILSERLHSISTRTLNCDAVKIKSNSVFIESCVMSMEEIILAIKDQKTVPAINKAVFDIPEALVGKQEAIQTPAPSFPDAGDSVVDRTLDMEKIRQKILAVFENEYKEHLETIRKFIDRPADEISADLSGIDDAYRAAHSLKGAARAVDLGVIQTLAHRVESLFSLIRDKKQTLSRQVILLMGSVADAIEDYAAAVLKGDQPDFPNNLMSQLDDFLQIVPSARTLPEIKSPAAPVKTGDYLHIEADRLDQLQMTCGRLAVQMYKDRKITRELETIEEKIQYLDKENERLLKQAQKSIHLLEEKPVFSSLVKFINFNKQETKDLKKSLHNICLQQSNLEKDNRNLISQIQEDIQQARMIKAQDVFQLFRKMVRDLALELNKNVDFQITGLDQKADRLVFQQLKDPVMHLLNNCVSHGIETSQQRTQAGKNETAHIRLGIEVVKNRLKLTVSDDGSGIDTYRILDVAVKKNLVTAEDAPKLSREQVLQFIFHPGFTSAAMVTDLSGRGMGLSVVKDAIGRLQGEIEVESSEQGTLFSLWVPLTILSHRVLVLEFENQFMGMPVSAIHHLIRIQTDQIQTIEGASVIYEGKEPIPFTSLNQLLSDEISLPAKERQIPVLVLISGNSKLAVAVDGFSDERDVIVKPLPGPVFQGVFSGGFFLEDGTMGLIVNPKDLMALYWKSSRKNVTFCAEEKKDRVVPNRILIVDDSITTRTLEKTILEAHGYKVFVAVNGQEALTLLKTIQVDLVITDVDMPVMDGFTFIQELKKQPPLKNIPVIIVSSMEDKNHKEQGLNLGVDAYIVKQKFEQQNLLETIQQII